MFQNSDRKEQLYRHIRKHQPILQADIVKAFVSEYKSKHAARISIGQILLKLEANGKIVKTKVLANRGLDKNKWTTK